MLKPWRRFRISTRCGMGLFLSVDGMKNAACCSGLFHPHNWFDGANIRNNIQTNKHSVIFLRFIFFFTFVWLAQELAPHGIHPATLCHCAPLLDGVGLVAVQFAVYALVTGYAHQLDVVRVVAQPFHLSHRHRLLNRLDVVAVNTGGHEALLLALLAQPASPLPHYALHLPPSL